MRVGLVWLLAFHGLVGVVQAQTDESAPTEATNEADDRRARIHFESGRQYFDEGEYERAVEEFTRAYELSHRPPLLMNIASGLERLGRYGEAADRMQAYHDQAEDTVPTRDVLLRRIANLRERAARAEAEAQADVRNPENPADPEPGELPPPAPASRSNGRILGAAISFGVAGAGLGDHTSTVRQSSVPVTEVLSSANCGHCGPGFVASRVVLQPKARSVKTTKARVATRAPSAKPSPIRWERAARRSRWTRP